jgi:hypothetical protein
MYLNLKRKYTILRVKAAEREMAKYKTEYSKDVYIFRSNYYDTLFQKEILGLYL